MKLVGRPEVALEDLRENNEREKHGVIWTLDRSDYPNDLASWNSASALTNTPTAAMRARGCT